MTLYRYELNLPLCRFRSTNSIRPSSFSKWRCLWTVRTERPRVLARVSILGQHSPLLLLAKSVRAQYVGIASVGTPARTRASTLGIRVNLGFGGTAASSYAVRRCASMIEFIKEAAGIRSKMCPAAFSMLFFCCVLYLHGHPRASPWLCPIAPVLMAQVRTTVPLLPHSRLHP